MYVAAVPNRNSPPAILLRESYRENGKVKTRTLANLSHLPSHQIQALRLALSGSLPSARSLPNSFRITRSLPHGHVAAVLGSLRCWGRRGTAPFQPVLAGARGTTEMSTHWRGRGKNSTSDSTFRLAYAETQAIIALCANSSCSHGREHRLSAASLFADCYGDRNHPNRGSSLVVAAGQQQARRNQFLVAPVPVGGAGGRHMA